MFCKIFFNNFDFGFTAVDEITVSKTTTPTNVIAHVDDEQLETILNKLERLELLILNSDNSDMINEHRELVKQDVVDKLAQVENLILPLLYNLQKNPEKDYIHWPNRTIIIDKQIEKIKAVTRFFNVV